MVKNLKLTPKGNGNKSSSASVVLHHCICFRKGKKQTLLKCTEGASKGSVAFSLRNLYWEILGMAFLEF